VCQLGGMGDDERVLDLVRSIPGFESARAVVPLADTSRIRILTDDGYYDRDMVWLKGYTMLLEQQLDLLLWPERYADCGCGGCVA
jgi:hypothetical protein